MLPVAHLVRVRVRLWLRLRLRLRLTLRRLTLTLTLTQDPRSQPDLSYRPLTKVRIVSAKLL